jgi:hypothetical protein
MMQLLFYLADDYCTVAYLHTHVALEGSQGQKEAMGDVQAAASRDRTTVVSCSFLYHRQPTQNFIHVLIPSFLISLYPLIIHILFPRRRLTQSITMPYTVMCGQEREYITSGSGER